MSTATIVDRQSYMNGDICHRDYYRQFVTDDLVAGVYDAIGESRIVASTDPYLNDIPLYEWDQLAERLPARSWNEVAHSNASTTRGGVPTVSLSDKVCILKAAAQTIKDS